MHPSTAKRSHGFFRESDQQTGYLSNFYPSPIHLDGKTWPSVEHFYQAQKVLPAHPQFAEKIRLATTPYAAKLLGGLNRQALRFPLHKKTLGPLLEQAENDGVTLRTDWEKVKERVMEEALQAKFQQHPELRKRLLAADPLTLREESPYDSYWGTGRDGSGLNRLGTLLGRVWGTIQPK